ncbi:barstar family protein [Pontibacter sp. Tf4]|uniref:barstar family protein n=1 Tax=Pontibacter sp. Tf4 TaxID=2761620 RepID=UPI0016284857|nr:barstar family protein [Pontibacter sp. Tf4]MBB6612214.1 barstar family protein [Pontibacter sp. Tf4]
MKKFILKAENLTDWLSFHKEFKRVLGFPEYYGENMNAWIDCLDELSAEEQILIHIENGKLLKEIAPEILEALLERAAFINYRKIDVGESPSLLISINI